MQLKNIRARDALLVLYTPARLFSHCGWISGLHLDYVGITDCVGLLTWEMKDVVSAVIELDCFPGHAVGLDDCMHCVIEKGSHDCFRIGSNNPASSSYIPLFCFFSLGCGRVTGLHCDCVASLCW